jgi:hypothetical protein
MGGVRKPTNILKMNGAFDKDPARGRAREGEPEVTEPLDETPPESFTEEETRAWKDLIKYAPEGVMKSSDYLAVELASRLLAEIRGGEAGASTVNRFQVALACFGMTPADRSRVSVAKTKKKDDWSDL